MLELQLEPGLPGGRRARLRELSGHEESLVGDNSSATAVALLDRLLVEVPGSSVRPGTAAVLATCDRDRLLAAIYRATFGDRIETRANCSHCGQPFELDFSLTALQANLAGEPLADGPDADGTYRLPDGRRFRLPTLQDEQALLGHDPAAAAEHLAKSMLVAGDPSGDPTPLLAALERHCPVLQQDITTRCVHCGSEAQVHFDLQSFLLATLAREGQWLARDVHCLAVHYHWSLAEILGLPRSQRHLFVALIAGEADARRGLHT